MTFLNALKMKAMIFDGGTGSVLVEEGLKAGEQAEEWNLSHPENIKNLHKRYLEAGADILKANTFGAYPHKVGKKQAEIVSAALALADEARKDCNKEAYIALDVGPLGKLLEPLGDTSFEEAVATFKSLVTLGKEKADLVLIETHNDLYELKAAVVAAKEVSELPIVVTVAIDAGGHLLTGADVKTVVTLLEGLGVSAIGFNCGVAPAELLPHVKTLKAVSSLPIVINANAGLPVMKEGRAFYTLTPESYAEEMKAILALTPAIVGGCCGTTPDHIAAIASLRTGCSLTVPNDDNSVAITSRNSRLSLDDDEIVIGRALDGLSEELADALKEGDFDSLLDEVFSMEDDGAEVIALDVDGFALPIDTLANAVKAIQALSATPLLLKSADFDSLVLACRAYNGRPLIGGMPAEALLPLAKAYGAVIALSDDEDHEVALAAAKTQGISSNALFFVKK